MAGEFGPQPNFASLGLETMSHKDPTFSIDTNSCEIKFKSSKPVQFLAKLTTIGTSGKDLSNYTFTQKYDGIIHVLLHFPEPAEYKFEVYALPGDTADKSLPNVFAYKIKVPNTTVYPFPKQYLPWNNGCTLSEPMTLNSQSSLTAVTFKVNIPNAKAAAVVINGKEWKALEKKDGHFCGTFDLDKLRNTDAKVNVSACFDDAKETYQTLLEYTI